MGQLAARAASLPDAFFLELLAVIERSIHGAENAVRYGMNGTLIAVGLRNPVLRDAALAAAARIGHVDVDHGDTSCETPDARASIIKAWAYPESKGFASPAAQERKRDLSRRGCLVDEWAMRRDHSAGFGGRRRASRRVAGRGRAVEHGHPRPTPRRGVLRL